MYKSLTKNNMWEGRGVANPKVQIENKCWSKKWKVLLSLFHLFRDTDAFVSVP